MILECLSGMEDLFICGKSMAIDQQHLTLHSSAALKLTKICNHWLPRSGPVLPALSLPSCREAVVLAGLSTLLSFCADVLSLSSASGSALLEAEEAVAKYLKGTVAHKPDYDE